MNSICLSWSFPIATKIKLYYLTASIGKNKLIHFDITFKTPANIYPSHGKSECVSLSEPYPLSKELKSTKSSVPSQEQFPYPLNLQKQVRYTGKHTKKGTRDQTSSGKHKNDSRMPKIYG